MCGIFGIITSANSDYSEKFLTKAIKKLAVLSQSRGKDSSGLCAYNQIEEKIDVVKGPIPAKELLAKGKSKELLSASFVKNGRSRYVFGHARLVTNGTQLNDDNNQPVVKDGVVGVHNGIVTNVDDLWEKYPHLERKHEIDTEVMLALVRDGLTKSQSIEKSTVESVKEVFGTVATAFVVNNFANFILATNNGSLYTIHNNRDILIFTSEQSILCNFIKKVDIYIIGDYRLSQIMPNNGINIDLEDFKIQEFNFIDNTYQSIKRKKVEDNIQISTINSEKEQLSTVVNLNYIHLHPNAEKEKALLQYPIDKIKTLKRCTKCLLPQTFPFIQYDDKGVCNYCNNYTKRDLKQDLNELKRKIEPFRRTNGKPDVLIPYSGGRDSTYVMHVVKKELELNPIAFTYDWGMVTDLARRNIARTCGKLGVENIIVAANIHMKRRNIRNNISTWLKKPDLGIIPLFMAGDKYFFYYNNLISVQNDLDISIWGSNFLENTDFKTGFCGVRPNFAKERIDDVNPLSKLTLAAHFGKNFIQNPSYFNSSLFDTFGSFISRYMIKRRGYFQMFDYLKWDEDEINNLIINKYGWEKAVDTNSTWRIGDGTASFYNYIYTLVVGFCENDTFRSNQIREGMITREEGLRLIYEENKPRYNSLKWYLSIIGLDYESTIKVINQIPRRY